MKNLIILGAILVLNACSTQSIVSGPLTVVKETTYLLKKPSLVGKTFSNQEVYIGGFSGLAFVKKDAGEFVFKTITDRGPNGWQIKENRPFLIPEYSPTIVELKTNSHSGEIEITQNLKILKRSGKPASGLPHIRTEENPVDVYGLMLSLDADGIDSEGIVLDPEGGYYISDEYDPSLIKVNSEGKMQRRFLPGFDLPKIYSERKTNRGFEGIALSNNHLYGFLQSPIPGDKPYVRIVELNLETNKTSAEYFYQLDKEADRIGDAVALPNGEFLVIEQNSKTGDKSYKKIYRIKLNSSDDLVTKTLVVDLDKTQFRAHEKVEGLTVIDSTHIALVNDNDFGITAETDFKTGMTPIQNVKTELIILEMNHSLF